MAKNPAPGTGSSYEPDQPKPQTNTPNNQNSSIGSGIGDSGSPAPSAPQLITLTPDQLSELVNRLTVNQTLDRSPAPSMTPGIGLQTNALGQVVGSQTKFNPDPKHYPDPREQLFSEPRLSRFSMDENYFLTWDITSKPYDTKYGISIIEPFFHMTLYMNMFDDQGEETGKAIVIQTLHFNEDEQIALEYAHEQGLEPSDETMRQIMDEARYERVKKWLFAIFFPERNFQPSQEAREEAIDGQVVKVVTKSNVKGFGNPAPKITDEELS